jgi:hypothetical protein
MHVARIESRLVRLECVEPAGMFGVQRAIGGHPVDHQIDLQGQPVLAGGVRERVDRLRGRLLSLEHRMQAAVVADHLSVTRPARLEEAADQRVIEAQSGCVSELCGPCIERPDEK